MHAVQVLSRWLGRREVVGHTARAAALVRVVQALLVGGKLSLTQLGRNLAGRAHATSLPHTQGSERRIKQLYTLRMQIEETFRDLKCHRWGFGLRYANCRTAKRLEVLLLVGTLAALVTWLVGLGARAMDWTRHLQANTVRKREVLSTFFIGRQLLACPPSLLPPLLPALITLRRHLLPPVPV